jgi:hypothetical protein
MASSLEVIKEVVDISAFSSQIQLSHKATLTRDDSFQIVGGGTIMPLPGLDSTTTLRPRDRSLVIYNSGRIYHAMPSLFPLRSMSFAPHSVSTWTLLDAKL